MALITCLECGREVSSLAPACPSCGCPIAAPNNLAVPVGASPAAPTATIPPIQPRTGLIVMGVLFIGIALWSLFSWIPAHQPWEPSDALGVATDLAKGKLERLEEWRLKPRFYYAANGIAVLLGLWGVAMIVRGATYRPVALSRKPVGPSVGLVILVLIVGGMIVVYSASRRHPEQPSEFERSTEPAHPPSRPLARDPAPKPAADAVRELELLKTTACQCRDSMCASSVQEDFNRFLEKHKETQGSQTEQERVGKEAGEMSECLAKAMTAGR